MIQSLFVKLGMLAMTIGVVFWIGWQAPHALVHDAASVAGREAGGLSGPAVGELERKSVDRSIQTARDLTVPAVEKGKLPHASSRGLLDLNRASVIDLTSLPGVGAVLAQRVIAFRKSVGGFQTIEELREVKGIGAKKFDQIKPLVTVAARSSKEKADKQPL